jgi:Protein of unknown function (DUF1501)
MNLNLELLRRRAFLSRAAYGMGGIALAGLFGGNATAGERWRGIITTPHTPVKAKRIIHLCMAGGPSHLETFDFKPSLKDLNDKPFPESFTKGQQLAQLQNHPLKAKGPAAEFRKWGKSGQEISTLLPHLGAIADDLCIVRSMHTEQINHDTAHAFMNSGSIIKGRPSFGSWMLYGLGSETEELPGFVVMTSQGRGGGVQPVSARQWSSGFLPSKFQGIQFQSKGDAVHYATNPAGVDAPTQRGVIDEVTRLNGLLDARIHDPEIATRISQYEMAFRMQSSVPDLTDMTKESKESLARYGITKPGDGSFASNCLLARRMAERGVRFIQLYHRAWDHHRNLDKDIKIAAKETDQASAALITDLKERGMLDDTLVLWGGEFGRTPMGQEGSGRDHHILGFSLAMAGGGIKPGITYGNTDELGYKAVENPVSVHDLHATMMHLCGIDHLKLTYRTQGRDFRLTDVFGEVVKPLLA